jgi:hypothetical protein
MGGLISHIPLSCFKTVMSGVSWRRSYENVDQKSFYRFVFPLTSILPVHLVLLVSCNSISKSLEESLRIR